RIQLGVNRQRLRAIPVLEEHVALWMQCASKDFELHTARLLLSTLTTLCRLRNRLVGELHIVSTELNDQPDSSHAGYPTGDGRSGRGRLPGGAEYAQPVLVRQLAQRSVVEAGGAKGVHHPGEPGDVAHLAWNERAVHICAETNVLNA